MFDRNILKELLAWKNSPKRKPLILRGARQVGKTSAVEIFAKKHFTTLININLEKAEHLRLFNHPLSLQEFLDTVSIVFKTVPNSDTLLFIDEIQNSPHTISLLRFFYEERPDLFVVAAGSLLEAKIMKEGLEMPVGRVDYRYLYPLDFFEYLNAIEETHLLEYLSQVSLSTKVPDSIHLQSIKHFYQFSMIGGMPEIVREFAETGITGSLDNIYSSLMTAYLEDVYKYSTHAKAKYISFVIENAPLYSGATITYERFAQSDYRSREISEAFLLLQKALLLHAIPATTSTEKPLTPRPKKPSKLIFLDIGLVNWSMGIHREFFGLKDLNNLYQGRIAEQIVGQYLIGMNALTPQKVFYWARQKPKGAAEVDFCFAHEGKLIGLEVKSGKSGRLKSLFQFAKCIGQSKLIRVSSNNLLKESLAIGGSSYELTTIPFYLLPRLFDVLSS